MLIARSAKLNCESLAVGTARDSTDDLLYGFGRNAEGFPLEYASELDLIAQQPLFEQKCFAQVFPKLRCVRVARAIEWRKSPDESWHPHVFDKDRLKQMLENLAHGNFTDVDGCIANAVAAGEIDPRVLQRQALQTTVLPKIRVRLIL